MPLERAAVLYPVNTTTVDSGAGIDIRLLDDVQAAADDDNNVVVATHTQDNVERTFDPGTTGFSTVLDARDLHGLGWALRLTEDMTPPDDASCNAYIPAGTATISLNARMVMSGGIGNPGAVHSITFRCSLWRYNPSTDTGTLIASGSGVQTWDTTVLGGESNVFKLVSVPITIANGGIEFSAGEILLLQVGLNTGTLSNPISGTTTFSWTLRVDNTDTKITWDTGQGIRQNCPVTTSITGKGEASREGLLAVLIPREIVGKGTASYSRATVASKSFDLVGKGVTTRNFAINKTEFNVVGEGTPTMSRTVNASKSFSLIGKGETTKSLDISIPRSAIGKGETTYSRQSVISKSFNLEGRGTVTEIHPVQAFRSFSVVGKGQLSSTIQLPTERIPTEGGATVKKIIAIFDD